MFKARYRTFADRGRQTGAAPQVVPRPPDRLFSRALLRPEGSHDRAKNRALTPAERFLCAIRRRIGRHQRLGLRRDRNGAQAPRPRSRKVYAGRHGIVGALTEDLIDTSKESALDIRACATRPAAPSDRHATSWPASTRIARSTTRLIDVFRAHDIGYFFYNGGNDSMDTAQKVSEIGRHLGYPLTCIGVPKTVDNDLPITDCCPGFGSAAKYIAISTREAALDVASMARTSTKVFVLEVMGRHAGWIAAAAGLAGRKAGDAPHVILFPEITFDAERFLAKVKLSVEKYGYCVVVVSEGVRDASGKFLAEAGTKDAFGHAQLGGVGPVVAQMTQEAFGYKFHWAVADYLQRSARHIGIEGGRRAGLCRRQGGRGIRCARPERGDARHRPQIGQALPLDHRRGTAVGGRQSGKEGAAQFHHDRRIRHHRGLPAVFVAADMRRGLPALRRRLAGLCRSPGRQRREAPAHAVCGIVAAFFLSIKSYFLNNIRPSGDLIMTLD